MYNNRRRMGNKLLSNRRNRFHPSASLVGTPNTLQSKKDIYTFKPLHLNTEYKTNVKRSLKYPRRFPKPRSGHRIVCNDRYVYSYGGYNPNDNIHHELFKELWKFDCVKQTWHLVDVNNIPLFAASNCCNLIGNIFTIFGGTGFPFGEEVNNSLYVLDLNELTAFREIKGENELEKPPKRYGQSCVVKDNYFYTIGGTTGFQYSMDIHRLDMRNGNWKEMFNSERSFDHDTPELRYRHEAILYKDQIFIIGGGTEIKAFGLEDVHAFDLSTNNWVSYQLKMDPQYLYPSSRKCHGCVQSSTDPSLVYIIAGLNEHMAMSDIWRLNLETRQWTKLNIHLPYKLYFHSVCINSNDKIYIFGGIKKKDDRSQMDNDDDDWEDEEDARWPTIRNTSAAIRKCDLFSVYLSIPKLKVICKEAIEFFYRNRQYDDEMLSTYGIQF